MITLQSARKYEELLGNDVEPAPYEYAMLFKAEGFFARRRSKRRFKLLKSLDAKLRRILQHGERVVFVTTGTTVSLGEQFFVGWLAGMLNRRALIYTSTRVLLLQIDGSGRPRELVSQIPYVAIASIKSTWNGICRVKLLDRTVYNFQGVPKPDRKFLVDFLVGIVQGSSAPFQSALGVEHLCPHCFVVVPKYPKACPACTGKFKSAIKAGLLSLLFPGLGDWYLGHRGFAVIEFLGACFLWAGLVVLPVFDPPNPELGPPGQAYWITAGIIIFLAHLIDGMMTRHFGRKGHHPDGAAPVRPDLAPTFAPISKPEKDAGKKLSISRPPASG